MHLKHRPRNVSSFSKEVQHSSLKNAKKLTSFFKGEHTIKSKTPVALNKGQAVFTEVISHISTLYYSKKKKKYMSKTAQMDIMLIFQDNQPKFAGTVSFDLATFPNTSVKS